MTITVDIRSVQNIATKDLNAWSSQHGPGAATGAWGMVETAAVAVVVTSGTSASHIVVVP